MRENKNFWRMVIEIIFFGGFSVYFYYVNVSREYRKADLFFTIFFIIALLGLLLAVLFSRNLKNMENDTYLEKQNRFRMILLKTAVFILACMAGSRLDLFSAITKNQIAFLLVFLLFVEALINLFFYLYCYSTGKGK